MTRKHSINPAWAEHVRRLVDSAPPLSPAQISRLAVLLQTELPSEVMRGNSRSPDARARPADDSPDAA